MVYTACEIIAYFLLLTPHANGIELVLGVEGISVCMNGIIIKRAANE
jgi:hypothetical protein